MLQIKSSRQEYHDATKHSYLSVAMNPNYVDSSTQPTPFKYYPKFYRQFPLNFNKETAIARDSTVTLFLVSNYKKLSNRFTICWIFRATILSSEPFFRNRLQWYWCLL
jgi:hypothetical protein